MAVLCSRFLVQISRQVLRFGADLQQGSHMRHHLEALFWCSPDSSHPLTWNAFQRCSLRASVDSTLHSMVRGLFLEALCNSSIIPRCASAIIRLLRWLLTYRTGSWMQVHVSAVVPQRGPVFGRIPVHVHGTGFSHRGAALSLLRCAFGNATAVAVLLREWSELVCSLPRGRLGFVTAGRER